jgi:uncharacterized protein YbjT (DUF2867 family)
MDNVNRILLIGGTGTVGRQVALQLSALGAGVRVMTRKPEEARLPPGVEVVRGDLTRPETLDACLGGIDAVFLVWVAPPAAVAPALERMARRARRIVLLSAPLKTPHPLFQRPNLARDLALQVERAIEASGVTWTFLRPGMFAPNAKEWWGRQIRAGEAVRWPYLAVPTAPIDERDIAAVAVRALREEGHDKAEYVLTGPQSLSQFEQVSIIGSAIGRTLRIEEMTPDEARRELLAIMPLPVVNMLLDAWGAASGQPAWVTSTVQEITGAPARTFLQWARDNATEFLG